MTPEALRRRMAHGNIYPPEKIDAALGNYFRVGNLTALRELALLWLADKVDDAARPLPRRARHRRDLGGPGAGRGRPDRRPRGRDADPPRGPDRRPHQGRATCSPCTSPAATGWPAPSPAHLARQRVLVESLGGTYHQVVGDDVPTALLDFARGVNATQLVLGASRRGRLRAAVLAAASGVTTTAESGPIDVHLVTHEAVRRGPPAAAGRPAALTAPAPARGLRAGRRCGLPLLTAGAGAAARRAVACASDILLFLAWRRGRRAGRRAVAGAGRRGRRLAAAQLLLHPAAARVHHRRARRTCSPWSSSSLVAVAVSVGGRPGRPAHPRGRPGPRRGRDPVHAGRQRAARRAGRCPRCSNRSGRPSA